MSGLVSGSQIDNSGVVDRYPPGHVIQVVGAQDIFSTSDFSGTDTTVKDSDGAGLTISNVTPGNLIRVTIAGGYHRMYGGSSAQGGCNWQIIASPNTGGDTVVAGTRLYMRDYNSDYLHVPINVTGIYTVPASVTSVEFLRQLIASTINSSWNNVTDTPMTANAMEIQT